MTNIVDWSKAPDGAEFYVLDSFCRVIGGQNYMWIGHWVFIANDIEELKATPDYQERPQPITEIRVGDFIHKSELDTEEKYNDVVRALRILGVSAGLNENDWSYSESFINGVYVIHDFDGAKFGFIESNFDHFCTGRGLTYDQIIKLAIETSDMIKYFYSEKSNKEHIDVDNCNVDKMVSMEPCELKVADKTSTDDQVKSPSHYQLMEGVESIEIIARSMTQVEWKGFCLGNMLKYRIRAGKKDSLQQDIDKANFYGELYEMHRGKCYDVK